MGHREKDDEETVSESEENNSDIDRISNSSSSSSLESESSASEEEQGPSLFGGDSGRDNLAEARHFSLIVCLGRTRCVSLSLRVGMIKNLCDLESGLFIATGGILGILRIESCWCDV